MPEQKFSPWPRLTIDDRQKEHVCTGNCETLPIIEELTELTMDQYYQLLMTEGARRPLREVLSTSVPNKSTLQQIRVFLATEDLTIF